MTDRDRLVDIWKRLNEGPWPSARSSDDLQGFLGDLVEYDSHLAGLTATALGGGYFKLDRSVYSELQSMEVRLASIEGSANRSDVEAVKTQLELLLDAARNLMET